MLIKILKAPDLYIGNKLVSYGQAVTVLTSWHAGRGDTSGTPTKEPDVIIEGAGFRWTSVAILSCDWSECCNAEL